MEELTLREKQKRQSREKIVKAAIALFGKQGLTATGIDQIMKKAGLTAGAFYAHFESKEQLIEEVLWSALPLHQHVPAQDFADFYLTPQHRDHPETACPLATLGSDLARADRHLKQRVAKRLGEVLEERIDSDSPEARRKALSTLAHSVGALILSRITKDTALSDEFLQCHRRAPGGKLKT